MDSDMACNISGRHEGATPMHTLQDSLSLCDRIGLESISAQTWRFEGSVQ